MDCGEYLRAPASGLRNRGRRLLEPERFGNSLRRVLAIDEGEVAPSRRQVGMAHPLHDLAGVGVADHGAAEGVAEIWRRNLARAVPCLRPPTATVGL
jgi:hypothetical protein